MSKYNACKTMAFGILFDSKMEAARYLELRALEKAGEIEGLHTQVKFELIPAMAGEKPVNYFADFTYNRDGKLIVEDVKGYKTQVWVLKRKLMLFRHGIRVVEVTAK